ncbi:hypothetical protein GCM10022267_12880 [Lentzea roselyniae]|uniref:N,N-dimethylformamidase beta subunit-like C-terminal domain-containing protein n=1 Tax=Lentzea roselyniae TaxID=531940 RepID=A0ABP7AA70_9PSEU
MWVNKDHNQPDHELRWYKLRNHTTVDRDGVVWINGNGALVGTGFTVTRAANLQGYTSWSVPEGGQLPVVIEQGGAHEVWAPRTFTGRRQLLQQGYRANGCNWQTDSTVPGGSWESGFHVVKLEGAYGMRQYIPFVVKPQQPRHKVALLLPYLTHNAYNHWGGHFQYTWTIAPRAAASPLSGRSPTPTSRRPGSSTSGSTATCCC